jgi:hypothetical protein
MSLGLPSASSDLPFRTRKFKIHDAGAIVGDRQSSWATQGSRNRPAEEFIAVLRHDFCQHGPNARHVAFQMAEAAVPGSLFADILRMAAALRLPPVSATG